jgi:trehalose utilization protein
LPGRKQLEATFARLLHLTHFTRTIARLTSSQSKLRWRATTEGRDVVKVVVIPRRLVNVVIR